MSSPSSLEVTKQNILILKKKLAAGRLLVDKCLTELTPSTSSGTNEPDERDNSSSLDIVSLTRVDSQRIQTERRARKLKRIKQVELIKDISASKETKLCLINDQDDECLSFDDDDDDEEDISKRGNATAASAAAASKMAPKNDYNQHFIDTGQRPQNFIRDPGLTERFEEYPKLRELIKLKDELISKSNVPTRPMYIKSDLLSHGVNDDFDLNELIGSEFDVILVEPPLHEYQITNQVYFNRYYTWEEIKAIDIGSIASSRAFIFLWCGSADGLDKGRECLKKWGFRRCEDICWIKTNKKTKTPERFVHATGIFQRTKEHCLMGIKGTVKRSSDACFIHTNIDIDLIISEEPERGSPDKPEEIFNIIEHFCLGKRRLHLFGGRHDQIRHGWLTVGPDLTETYFDRDLFKSSFLSSILNSAPGSDPNAVVLGSCGNLTGTTERIEALRPRTPPVKAAAQQQQQQQQQNKSNSLLPPPPPPTTASDLANLTPIISNDS